MGSCTAPRWLALSVAAIGITIVQPMFIVAYAAPQLRDGAHGASSRAAGLDSIARQAIAAGKTPGMAVVIVQGSDTLLARGYGMADVERQRPVLTSSIFRVGSVTKQFTAAAVLRLVAANRIALSDSIRRYVPAMRGPAGDATIHQLLSHTAGIASYTELPAFRARVRAAIPVADMVALVDGASLRFPHGTRWAYNNSGYYLLGLVVQRVTGEPYARHLRQVLLAPASLDATGYCGGPDGVTESVVGYDMANGRADAVAPLDMANPFAAGALCASATDLARWTAALMSGRVLDTLQLGRMTTPVALADGRPTSYGYGMEITTLGGHRRIGHGGSISGFESYVAHYPDRRLTVVVLTNNASANAEALEKSFARHVLGIDSPVIAEVPLAPHVLARYAGSYRAGPGRVIVSVRGPRLHVSGPVDADLAHLGAHTFVMTDEPDVRLVFQVSAESVTGISWTSRGRTLELPRIP